MLRISAAALFILTIAARLGNLHWFADYLALLHDWYLWVGLLLLVGSASLRKRSAFALSLTSVLLNAWLVGPYFLAPQSLPNADSEPPLRLMTYNIYARNEDLASVVTEVQKHDPDVLFLMEYSYDVQREIEEAFATYPHRLIFPSRWTMGLALFSKFPLENTAIHRNDVTQIPIFQANILVDETTLGFVGAHPYPPLPKWGNLHREQMADVIEVAANAKHPLIVTGDFNASPWSSTLATLREQANVRDAHLGHGIIKTWRRDLLRLTLDHTLISHHINVRHYALGDFGGSDHAPLIVDFQITTPE